MPFSSGVILPIGISYSLVNFTKRSRRWNFTPKINMENLEILYLVHIECFKSHALLERAGKKVAPVLTYNFISMQ